MLMPIGKMVMVMDWHFIFVVECEFLVEKLRKIISCNIYMYISLSTSTKIVFSAK